MAWKKLSLRFRAIALLASLGLIAVASGVVVMWYAHEMDGLVSRIVDRDIGTLKTINDLLQALMKQKGYVSYYFIDRDPVWLESLELHRREFRDLLERAEGIARTEQDRTALEEIRSQYRVYIDDKDRVMDLYRKGEVEAGLELHKAGRSHFFDLLALCEALETTNVARIRSAAEESRARAARIRIIAAATMLTAVTLISMFAFILLMQILGPIRRLAGEADGFSGRESPSDEVKTLSRRVRGLIENADQTHSELERSRARLLQTEKMATVGKMAAGVAHSLRNPMTSIKMRLFSLERSLQVSPGQKEDLEVISEEIRHMDNIVQNFLHYSRPAKLKMERINPAEIVDASLQLLKHRFRSYGIQVNLNRAGTLPEIPGDADQLKEVFVNILVNALEAMAGSGGEIWIEEALENEEPIGPVVVIRIRDSGPGIAEDMQEKVFEPFFSTKEEGTGLGLSIAVRIVSRHSGFLRMRSKEGNGTEFTIVLPCRGNAA